MARPPRPTPPSAIDGFRRLERTRTVATPTEAIAGTATFEERPGERLRRPRTTRRVAGALRLVAFVAALVIVVGTSVSLAGSGGSDRPRVEPATSSSADTSSTTPAADEPDAVDDAVMAESSAEPAHEDTVVADEQPATIAAAAVPDTAPAPSPSRSLPFTDSVDLQRLLLAGSALLLIGMLMQVAGQPLPARVRP